MCAMVENKLSRGHAQPEHWYGREALLVIIGAADFEEYLSHPGGRLSYAVFNPHAQSKWVGRDGRF